MLDHLVTNRRDFEHLPTTVQTAAFELAATVRADLRHMDSNFRGRFQKSGIAAPSLLTNLRFRVSHLLPSQRRQGAVWRTFAQSGVLFFERLNTILKLSNGGAQRLYNVKSLANKGNKLFTREGIQIGHALLFNTGFANDSLVRKNTFAIIAS
jgi:hypothetical protein